MSNYLYETQSDQRGSALVITILVMLALTALGILAMNTSSIDVKIAANDQFKKKTFYTADGGCEMTTELIEQNIEERGFGVASVSSPVMREQVSVYTGDFYLNVEDSVCQNNNPSPTNRDIQTPRINGTNVYIRAYGNTELSTGSALQIAAGDKGRGKGLAGGGAQIVYDIRCLGKGLSQSQAKVLVRWAHKI